MLSREELETILKDLNHPTMSYTTREGLKDLISMLVEDLEEERSSEEEMPSSDYSPTALDGSEGGSEGGSDVKGDLEQVLSGFLRLLRRL